MSEPRSRLTFRRFSGLDRSGPPPPETLPGAPLRPWTIPNAIGYLRLALIPVFLVLAWNADGVSFWSAFVFGAIAVGDYVDGIAARVTGQYSRLGSMLDPVVDRLFVIAGVVVCWQFDLMWRPLLLLIVARELLMLIVGPFLLRRGARIEVNWWGRWGVWPVMGGIFLALCGLWTVSSLLVAVGVVLLYVASAMYLVSTRRQIAESKTST
ncbi:MAG: CDP-alcohol phosphatidyltransferase family protein [Solirubrobacteraceae bacterium]|nr:CDP-alcohol phosphatidyltransferase family protein [Solirubrobacteraceae bacterium]